MSIGLPLGYVHFCQSYLTHRTQATRIGDIVSTTINISSGVPQGSILGPYFYCLVAATLLPVNSSTRLIKYIDDVTYCIPLQTDGPRNQVLEEHKNVVRWSHQNRLTLNESKSKSLFFPKATGSHPQLLEDVEHVKELKILGVKLNDQLTWDSHIDMMIKISSQRIYALRILKPMLTKNDLRKIYFSLVRSLLEYVSPLYVYLPQQLDSKIERFQNRVHKLICSLPRQQHATDCDCSSFPNLRQRRHQAAIRLFRQAANDQNHILHCIIPDLSQTSSRFLQPPSITSRRRNSFIPFTCILVNNIIIV